MSNVQTPPPVTADDRISDVLARDESLIDVFVRHAPHFEKLRDRAMRRVMARLVTVEEAAQTANVATERLVRDLNEALGLSVDAIGRLESGRCTGRTHRGARPSGGSETRRVGRARRSALGPRAILQNPQHRK